MQNVIENITKHNFDGLVQSEKFVELPQLKGYLAIFFFFFFFIKVNLPLNMIHF